MSCRAVSRVPFLMAVGLVAAALGDPLVETIANTGVLGRGYSDNNHLSVLPALFAGLALVLEVLVFRSLQVYRESAHRRRDWLADVGERISARPPLNDLPYVLCFQLAALFCMESIEQLAFGGKLLGGTAWLGGPAFFSLAMHASIGVACTFAIARAMRAMLKALARVIGEAIDLVLIAFGAEAVSLFTRRREPPAYRLTQSVHVRQIGERAPPLLLALT